MTPWPPGSNSIKGNGRATLMSLNDFIGIEPNAFKIVTIETNLKIFFSGIDEKMKRLFNLTLS